MNTPNPYAPPQAAVADIADPNGPAPHAERSTRLVAAILDGLIGAILIYTPLLFGGVFTFSNGKFNPAAILGGAGLLALLGFVIWCVITYVLVKRNGQTIGKKMLGIKVVRTDGSRASVGRIFWLRNFVNGILGVIPLYGLVDILLIFGEPRRCVHDKLADTIVVKA
jgi:uncharacterized RDD family membrane protein YckC